MEKLLPQIPQVAVFDTSFHQTMPEYSYMYGIPYEYYNKYKLRRYGFHGTSHKYKLQKKQRNLSEKLGRFKIITCHLGQWLLQLPQLIKANQLICYGLYTCRRFVNGNSCRRLRLRCFVILNGKRRIGYCGANNLINKKSGLLGVSGVSSDMRDLEKASEEGNSKANLALEIFSYRVKKYVGSYIAALGGLDLLIFTGGIGENACKIREAVCKNMEFIGINFDSAKNHELRGKDEVLTTPDSKTIVMAITTNEEYVIAKDTYSIVSAMK